MKWASAALYGTGVALISMGVAIFAGFAGQLIVFGFGVIGAIPFAWFTSKWRR